MPVEIPGNEVFCDHNRFYYIEILETDLFESCFELFGLLFAKGFDIGEFVVPKHGIIMHEEPSVVFPNGKHFLPVLVHGNDTEAFIVILNRMCKRQNRAGGLLSPHGVIDMLDGSCVVLKHCVPGKM